METGMMRGGFKLTPLRILLLTRIYPYRPAFGGEISYSRGVIESLGKSSELTVLAATNGTRPPGAFDANAIHWHLVPASRRPQMLSVATAMPNMIWRNATSAYHGALKELLKESWDAVVIDHFASVHVLSQVKGWRKADPSRCLLYLSHEHERTTRKEKYASYGGGPLQLAIRHIDGWKIGKWEDAVIRAADIVSLINPSERALFDDNVAAKRYVTTLPGYDGVRCESRRIDETTPMRIALLGGRGPIHKRNILRDWLAASASAFAEAGVELDVIGDINPGMRAELQRRYPSVRFSGFVKDLESHLQRCRLGVIADTVGRGVKLRLTSYVFARVPMAGITGAIDGLPLRPRLDYAEAPTLEALASLCLKLVRDVDTLNVFQENAFKACDGRFDWATRGADLVEAIRALRRDYELSLRVPVSSPHPDKAGGQSPREAA